MCQKPAVFAHKKMKNFQTTHWLMSKTLCEWIDEPYPSKKQGILEIFAKNQRYLVQASGCPDLSVIK